MSEKLKLLDSILLCAVYFDQQMRVVQGKALLLNAL